MNYNYNSGLVPMSKDYRCCATCEYWNGQIRVVSKFQIKYNKYEKATCNVTGFEKSGMHRCSEHEFKRNLK